MLGSGVVCAGVAKVSRFPGRIRGGGSGPLLDSRAAWRRRWFRRLVVDGPLAVDGLAWGGVVGDMLWAGAGGTSRREEEGVDELVGIGIFSDSVLRNGNGKRDWIFIWDRKGR